MSKLGMVSTFHPHSMCKRVERFAAKTGRTSCTNWTISFEVSGFLARTHLLHGHFIFLNLLQLQTFLRSVHTIQSDIISWLEDLDAVKRNHFPEFENLSTQNMRPIVIVLNYGHMYLGKMVRFLLLVLSASFAYIIF